jgi:protein subunit release factor B
MAGDGQEHRPAMQAAYAVTDTVLLAACRVEVFRASGPGGQHTNRTESAVRLTHEATGVVAQVQDHRERARNQGDALRRLRLRLALAIRGQANRGWLERYRRGRQLGLGAQAQDYHLVVAVVFDALDRHAGSLAAAAEDLGVSSTQLAKLLTADKEVHAAANALRARHGQGAIHA